MAMCEKCWGDAYLRYRTSMSKSQAEHYEELLKEREDNPCTPEEQAGSDASECPKCERNTVHQHAKICTICGYDAKPQTTHEHK